MRKSTPELFWSKVEIGLPDECWEWQAYRDVNGYGRVMSGGQCWHAHRLAYFYHYGYLTTGLDVCHACDNPPCCNWGHLWEGTRLDNLKDMRAKGRQPEYRGASNPNSKLSEDDVREIRRLVTTGLTYAEVGRKYGVVADHISRIFSRNKWRHVP